MKSALLAWTNEIRIISLERGNLMRIVCLVLGLSLVSLPTLAKDLFMSCSFGFLRGLAPAPSLYKYSDPWIGPAEIYVQSSGKWEKWCRMPSQIRTIHQTVGVCNTQAREGGIIVSKIDFNEYSYAIIKPRVKQFECKRAPDIG